MNLLTTPHTSNVCRGCRSCTGFRTDVDCFAMTVVRTGYFSHTFPATRQSPLFLKDVNLIPSKVLCKTCGQDRTRCAEPSYSEGFCWRCYRRSAGIRCRWSLSIKDGSWCQQNNLTILKILLIVHIVCGKSEVSCEVRSSINVENDQ